ncbi:MAG: hypothetical protein AAB840_01735 [Patescibacteria group bacterium]
MLAIPYCFLAGWSTEGYTTIGFVAPAFLTVWFMAAIPAGVVKTYSPRKIYFDWRAAFGKSNRQALPGSLTIFWAWTLYSLLPIIAHWGAMLLEKIGHQSTSSLIDKHRYMSPLFVFMATLILFIILMMMNNVWEKAKKMWAQIAHR